MIPLRRLLLLMSIVGVGAAVYSWWQRRDQLDDDIPEWPPFPEAEAAPTPASVGGADRNWVDPDDGTCPIGHPVKLNETSGIFHVPGGRFYERTKADRCYASAEAALADGYRAAKA